MLFPRCLVALLVLPFVLAACSDPERVRLASAPLPPLPRAKPLDASVQASPGSRLFSRGTAAGGIEVTPLDDVAADDASAAAPSRPATQGPGADSAPGSGQRARLLQPAEKRYVVQSGDTLFSISQSLEVPLAAMIDANELRAPFELRVGQALTVPSVRVYEVESGETLYSIAKRQGVSTEELAQANRLDAPYRLWGGQKLVLPGAASDEPLGEVDVTLAEAAAAAAPAERPEPPAPEQEIVDAPPVLAEVPEASLPEPEAEGPEAGSSHDDAEPGEPRRLAAVPAPPPRSGGRFLWPLQGEQVANFGPQGDGRHNDGINIAAPRGTQVVAAENGVVAYAGNELRGFGNLLLIKHSDDWITAYAHNDRLLISAGESVTRGQPIAEVGSSGSVSKPQLHFEIRKGTRAVDPLPLLEGGS